MDDLEFHPIISIHTRHQNEVRLKLNANNRYNLLSLRPPSTATFTTTSSRKHDYHLKPLPPPPTAKKVSGALNVPMLLNISHVGNVAAQVDPVSAGVQFYKEFVVCMLDLLSSGIKDVEESLLFSLWHFGCLKSTKNEPIDGIPIKDIKVKKSKNKQKPTRNEETSDQEKDLKPISKA
ncbi:hypothetical protein Tco_1147935 [Tanacetum coccineum]